MIHETKCKFCKAPLSLQVDDAYGALGDPSKLYKYAACNTCADRREQGRILRDKIEAVCRNFVAAPSSKVLTDNTRHALEKLVRKYTVLISKWVGVAEMDYNEDIVEALMKHPGKLDETLRRVWESARHSKTLL